MREKESALRTAVLRKFHEFGIRSSVIIEAGNPDFFSGYVKQNKGVSFMNEHEIKEELEKGILKVIPIDEGNIILFSDIIYHTEKPLSPSAEAFLKMVEELRGQIRREFKALSASLIAPIPH